MLQKGLKVGGGALLSGMTVIILASNGITFGEWRAIMIMAMISTMGMLFHHRLRRYMLLPCIVAASALVVFTLHAGILAEG